MLAGDNGILQKSTTAKQNSEKAQIEERIKLAYHASLASGQGTYTKESLEDELKKEFGDDYEVDDSDNNNWVLIAGGQSVTIPAGKEDTSKVTIKVGTTNLKEVANLSTLYGQTTDYISVSNVQWQLFYDDNEWIYLVASDYVPVDILPNELLKEDPLEEDNKYHAGFSNTIMQNEPWSNGANSNTVTGNLQTNTYLKWVNSDIVTTKDNINMKAVAFMMDTDKWSNFVGNVNGAYAMGGPTIEMFALSYNSKHDVKMGTYLSLNSDNINSNGYAAKVGDAAWKNIGGNLDASSDNMWVGKSPSKCDNWILCSPSATHGDLLCMVSRQNGFLNDTPSPLSCSYTGFRPLIAIPKYSLK